MPQIPSKTLRLYSRSPTSCPLRSKRDTRHRRRGYGLLANMLGVVLLGVLVLELLVLLMLFGAGGDVGVLF